MNAASWERGRLARNEREARKSSSGGKPLFPTLRHPNLSPPLRFHLWAKVTAGRVIFGPDNIEPILGITAASSRSELRLIP